jgi:aryl sulfotransferase
LLPPVEGHLACPTCHDLGVGDGEMGTMPTLDRVYQNHHLDSKRWASFEHRPGDIVISTSYKAGTTWMQRIISLLIFGPDPLLFDLTTLSPWIDARWSGSEEVTNQTLAGQTHRRFVKSHLPLDAIPYWDDVRYIAVGRDSRDVFMSIFNHWSAYTDFMYQLLATGEPVGGPMPRCPADPRMAWAEWITTGSFPWEKDGSPWWSHHYHVNSFWRYRHLPNILLVHYADMKADLDGEMRRIAAFLGIDIDESNWPNLVQRATFESMKQDAQAGSENLAFVFEGGSDRFFFKGINGRWREVLTAEDLGLYETAVARLEPDLRTWLEGGRSAAPNLVPSPVCAV